MQSKRQPGCTCTAQPGTKHAENCAIMKELQANPPKLWPTIDRFCVNHGTLDCEFCETVVGTLDPETRTVYNPSTGETTAWILPED